MRIFAIIPALVLACCGSERVATNGPRSALKAYIAAVRSNRPQAAYELLDKRVRQRVSKEEFVARWKASRKELEEQAREIEKGLGKPMEVKAKLSLAGGVQAKLRRHGTAWRIDSGITIASQARTPNEALQAMLRAVKRRDYRAVMRLMSRQVREGLEREINDRVKKLEAVADKKIEADGDKATVRVRPYRVELIKEGDNWRVADFD